MKSLKLTAKSIGDLRPAAEQLLAFAGNKRVIAFFGAMGAGKTTFIKVICEVLGVTENVSSPTFALIHEYRDGASKPVFHFDFYRIKNPKEAVDIGVDEYFYSNHYCFVEWPEKVLYLLPEDYISVTLVAEDETRLISAERKI